MSIAITALKEKVRRKELYIVMAIGILLAVIFCSGTGSITINGEPVTGYRNLITLMIPIEQAICGALAIALSLRTIPDEYQRRTSHLIWIRGVSQPKYHGELALANLLGSTVAAAILFGGIFVLSLIKGETGVLYRMVPAFLIFALSIAIVSLMVSVLSIKLPSLTAGVIGTVFFVVGILHSILELVEGMITGFASILLKVLLIIVPDLHALKSQATAVIRGEAVNIHILLKGLLTLYIISLFLLFFKRKEA